MPDPETGSDLLHRMSLDVLPLERIAVAGGQPVEHDLHQPTDLQPTIGPDEVVFVGSLERLDGCTQVRLVIDEYDVIRMSPVGTQVIDYLAPADLAQPR